MMMESNNNNNKNNINSLIIIIIITIVCGVALNNGLRNGNCDVLLTNCPRFLYKIINHNYIINNYNHNLINAVVGRCCVVGNGVCLDANSGSIIN